MVKKHDSGDVRGLEELFRSQEFSRVSGAAGSGPGEPVMASHEDTLFKRMFGHAHAAVTDLRRSDNDAPRHPATATPPLDGLLETDAIGGLAAGGEAGAAGLSDPWKRESGRYWTIAAVSALVALVVAGVTAGNGQHALHISAQGKQHGTAQSHRGPQGVSGASTNPSAPGSLTSGVGSGALLVGLSSTRTRDSASGSGDHVTLGGAATTTGTPFPSATTTSGGSPGGGAGGVSPALGGTDPVAAGVGSTVNSVGTSVTVLANQIGTAIPTAAPTATAVNGVVSTLDQAVGAATL